MALLQVSTFASAQRLQDHGCLTFPNASSGGALSPREVMDHVADSTNFDCNKQSCVVHCFCSVCELPALFMGMSHRHFCSTTSEQFDCGVAIGAATSPVEITKILYPPAAYYSECQAETERTAS